MFRVDQNVERESEFAGSLQNGVELLPQNPIVLRDVLEVGADAFELLETRPAGQLLDGVRREHVNPRDDAPDEISGISHAEQVPGFLERRGGGSIINFASVQATSCSSGVCVYATTKGAILSFTRTLAVDFARHNIRANTICPGSIITPMQEHFAKANTDGRTVEEMYKVFARPVPLQRLGEAWEIAELAAFLAGPRSTFCTGGEFRADGGLLAGLRLYQKDVKHETH